LNPDPDLDPVFFKFSNYKITFENNHDKKCFCPLNDDIFLLRPKCSTGVLPNDKKSLQLTRDRISSFFFFSSPRLFTNFFRFLIFEPSESGSILDPYGIPFSINVLKRKFYKKFCVFFYEDLHQEKTELGSHFSAESESWC
jgi:hypothetical protein